jgi:hypothetical protein
MLVARLFSLLASPPAKSKSVLSQSYTRCAGIHFYVRGVCPHAPRYEYGADEERLSQKYHSSLDMPHKSCDPVIAKRCGNLLPLKQFRG